MREKLNELLKNKRYAELRSYLDELQPIDIAPVIEELDADRRALLFRICPKEFASEVFIELDPEMQQSLITGFSDSELKEILDELYLDDAVDIIEEMPATVVKRILRQSDKETRRRINELLKYPKSSAGSIMTPEFVDLKKDMTVAQAIERIRRTAIDKETVYTCYCISARRHLEGVVTVRQLLLARDDELISDVMETNVISARTLDDREDVARLLDKYDLSALPIVDNENRLVGIVTFDDAMDVIEEENTEDIERMAAIISAEDKPYLKIGIFETVKARIPWLLILMLSATFTGAIISGFEAKLKAIVVLTAFIPMLMGTGGNSGSQASVTIIRGLSLKEIKRGDILRVIMKELRVGVICGAVLGVVNFGKILLVDHLLLGAFGNSAMQEILLVDLSVCLAVLLTVIVAKLVGAVLPILAEALRLDPAVMASPFITTIVDAISLVIYFSISTSLLGAYM